MADDPDKALLFEAGARSILASRIAAFEQEIYSLLDAIEGLENA